MRILHVLRVFHNFSYTFSHSKHEGQIDKCQFVKDGIIDMAHFLGYHIEEQTRDHDHMDFSKHEICGTLF